MRKRRPLRRLSSLGAVFVASALLVGLFLGTNWAIERSEREADDHRLDDRVALTQAVSEPLRDWLQAGRVEAQLAAAAVGGDTNPLVLERRIEEFLRQDEASFSRSLLVVDAGLVARAASPDRAGMVPRPVPSCVGVDSLTPLRAMVAAAAGPRVSGVVPLPGSCRQGVTVSARAPSGLVVLVFAELAEVQSRVAPVAEATAFRIYAIAPGNQAVLSQRPEVEPVPPHLTAFLGDDTQRLRAGEYGEGVGKVAGVFRPLGDGWGYAVEESADAFALPEGNRPSVIVPLVLTVVLGAVFAIVAWFDVRRRRAARRADEHRDAFLAVVGHELRTPLTVIKGYTETLANRWDALSDESRHMLISNMAPQTQRQARVIEHLLTAASLQAGTLPPPVIEPTDVAAVLQGVVAEFRPLAPLHAFGLDVPADIPLAQADARTLAQAVGELVDNAVRYSPSGGRVLVAAKATRGAVVITVEDEGVGLPASRRRLFEPFVQGEDVDRRLHDEGGIGVGLYIARALVSAMGGSVEAEPRQPSGARLTVTVPAVRSRRLTPA